jgi:hypothetical protein
VVLEGSPFVVREQMDLSQNKPWPILVAILVLMGASGNCSIIGLN